MDGGGLGKPPPYAPMDTTDSAPDAAANVFDRLTQKGFGPKTVGTLKRQTGQDHWKA